MANRYLIKTANWNDASAWSATSGGAGGAGVPTAGDYVFINANYTVTITSDVACDAIVQYTGTITNTSYNVVIKNYIGSTGSTARTINMGSGKWTITNGLSGGMPPSVITFNGSNFTLNAGTSLLEINTASSGLYMETNGKTFNDVKINLGYSTSGVTFNITGSPTFRLLDIRSANSAAHTVNFDSASTINISKFIAIGSSSGNKLTIQPTSLSSTFQNIDTSYGQFVHLSNIAGYPLAFDSPLYIGSNSSNTSSIGWTFSNPPKISTLIDPLTTTPASNTNWTVTGTVTTVTSGHDGGGYQIASPSEIVSTGSYDFIDSEIIIELVSGTFSSTVYLQDFFSWSLSNRYTKIFHESGNLKVLVSSNGLSWSGYYSTSITSADPKYKMTKIRIVGSSVIGSINPALTSAPTVTTGAATSLTDTTVTIAGNVTSDNGLAVTERGVVYSTSPNPTTANSKKTVAGTTGAYTANITGLTAKTTYYAKAYAINSDGTGYGTEVSFTTKGAPTANFNQSSTTAKTGVSIDFTDTSTFEPTSWLWTFGDGTTSTAQNPTKSYATSGVYTVSLKATNAYGNNTVTKTNLVSAYTVYDRTLGGTFLLSGGVVARKVVTRTISGTFLLSGGVSGQNTIHIRDDVGGTFRLTGGVNFIVLRDTQAIEEKRYLYKVYDEAGQYIETWSDVADELQYTTEINELGSSCTVILARNSDSVGVSTAPLQTEAGTNITTQAGQDILVTTESRNQIGPGSSVQHNNRVDVYVFYGEVSPLLTEYGEEITTEYGEVILASIGAPNGRRIFSGFISEINSRYGNTETVVVQLSSYGYDLNQFVLDDALGNTTIPFNSTDPSNIAMAVMDRFAAASSSFNTLTRRTPTSISTTGTTVSYTFRVNNYGDVLKKILELMPSDWYFYIGLGDNTVYFRQKAASPQHKFYLGKHIKALDLKSSILDVQNDVYFTGGGDPALFIRTTAAPASRTRRGLNIYSDSRVTIPLSAEIISEGIIDEKNKVQYRTSVEILSKVYDIESINVGDMVAFRNFGSFVDTLDLMQVQGINYSPDSVVLALQTLPPTINKRLADLKRNQEVNDSQNVPSAPA